MRVFVSFASEQSRTAESIYRKLLAAGYDVFFSSESIRAGEGYDERIRKAIVDADKVIFLASPDSLAKGCYTLTELQMISRKWEDPTGVVMPVLLEGATYDDLPTYLGAVTSAIEPKGHAPSEVVATVVDVWPPQGAHDERVTSFVGAILIALLLVLGGWMVVIESSGFASAAFDVERGLHRPTRPAPRKAVKRFCDAVRRKARDWPGVSAMLTDEMRATAASEVLAALIEREGTVPKGVEGVDRSTRPDARVRDTERLLVTGLKALVGEDFPDGVEVAPREKSESLLGFLATYEQVGAFQMYAAPPDSTATTATWWGYGPRLSARPRAARFQVTVRWVAAQRRWLVSGVTTMKNPMPQPKPASKDD